MRHSEGDMNISELLPDVKKIPILCNSLPENIAKYLCADRISANIYRPGETVIPHDTLSVKVGIILHGTVEINSGAGNDRLLLKTAGENEIFGIATLYCRDAVFPTVITAKTSSEILFVECDALRELLENDKGAMEAYLSMMSRKIVYLNKKIVSYTVGNTEQRLAFFLCENEVGGVVSPYISMTETARMLNMGRASLYRSLDSLEMQGLILRQGKKILIPSTEKLKKILNL